MTGGNNFNATGAVAFRDDNVSVNAAPVTSGSGTAIAGGGGGGLAGIISTVGNIVGLFISKNEREKANKQMFNIQKDLIAQQESANLSVINAQKELEILKGKFSKTATVSTNPAASLQGVDFNEVKTVAGVSFTVKQALMAIGFLLLLAIVGRRKRR